MDPLVALFFWKLGRFALGIGVTILAGYLGYLRGKTLRERGVTGETFSESQKVTVWMVARDLLLVFLLVKGLGYLDRKFSIFSFFARFLQQIGLVSIRSVLVFLFFSQWQIWTDKTRLRRAGWVIAVAVVVMAVVEVILLCPATVLVGDDEIEPRSGVVLQTCSISCGPASLVNILRAFGRMETERETVMAMGIGLGGSFDDELIRGAVAMGFPQARSSLCSLDEVASADLPLIVSLDYFEDWRGSLHAVAILGISSATVTYADPLIGLRTVTRKDFEAQWKGPAVHLGPPAFPASRTPRLSTFDPAAFKKFSLECQAASRAGGK